MMNCWDLDFDRLAERQDEGEALSNTAIALLGFTGQKYAYLGLEF